MNPRPPRPAPGYQRGAVTLTIAVLLMFIVSLLTLFSARLGTQALREAGASLQRARAMAAARSGIHAALSALRPAMLHGGETDGPAGILPDGSRYRSRIRKTAIRRLRITVMGRSGTGKAWVHQEAAFLPYAAVIPPAAVMARGAADLGQGWVIPFPAGLRAWTGGTLVRRGRVSTGVTCRRRGLCARDARLAALDAQAWRRRFLTLPLDLLDEAARAPGPADEGLYYAGGDAENPAMLEGMRLGSESSPALVVVEGDLAGLRHSRIHGLLYVSGDCLARAEDLVLEGALVVAGRLGLEGMYRIRHRPDILRTLQDRLGRFALLPGTWRDGEQ